MRNIILGFDFGLKRIGVAVGNGVTATASALAPLRANEGNPDWEAVRRLLEEWKPQRLVVGLPLNMDGTPSEMSARAERFARRLEGRFNLRCEMMDERLSTFEARGLIAESGSEASRDSVAACLVLESWFARAGESPTPG
jgi:putative Holliday junction resolvase